MGQAKNNIPKPSDPNIYKKCKSVLTFRYQNMLSRMENQTQAAMLNK